MAKTKQRRKTNVAAVVGALSILGAGAIAGGMWVAGRSAIPVENNRIAPGIQIADVTVGGLTRVEAAERMRRWARKAVARPVTLVGPKSGRRWNFSLADVGGRFDLNQAVEKAYQVGRDGNQVTRFWARAYAAQADVRIAPTFHLDQNKLKRQLERVGTTVHVPARNAQATMQGQTLVVTRRERAGARLDVEATRAALLHNGENALHDGGKALLVMVEEKPPVSAADLGQVNHLLGAFATRYGSSSRDRRHNVELAAAHINGTLVAPGATFSYNDTVGPRWRRLGWREAPTYQDGLVVPGTGGGICQVSSTLYNAAVLADMKIVRRSHHSMPVKYVSPGRDATVAYGAIDLQFRNTTGGPVYVAARANGGRLTMALYGKVPARPRQVQIVSGPRRGRTGGGFVVTTYRVVTGPAGRQAREILSVDRYRPLRAAPVRRRMARARMHRAVGTARREAKPGVVAPATRQQPQPLPKAEPESI